MTSADELGQLEFESRVFRAEHIATIAEESLEAGRELRLEGQRSSPRIGNRHRFRVCHSHSFAGPTDRWPSAGRTSFG